MKNQNLRLSPYATPGIHKYVFKKNAVTTETVVNMICNQYFKVDPVVINMKTRKRNIVEMRQICHFFSKFLTTDSLYKIGKIAGDKDHATVLHALKTVINLCETDSKFRLKVIDIYDLLCNNIHVDISLQSMLDYKPSPKTKGSKNKNYE